MAWHGGLSSGVGGCGPKKADVVWLMWFAGDVVTPGPLPQPLYLPAPIWLVAVVGSSIVGIVLALKAADYTCRCGRGSKAGASGHHRCITVSRRMRSSGDRPTSFLSLLMVFQAVVRLTFSFAITTRMYYVDPAKRTYLWVHVAALIVGVVISAAVVVYFFRRLARSSSVDAGVDFVDPTALALWHTSFTTAGRMVKMLAVVKPGVLLVLQSGISPAFEIPVPMLHSCWR